MKILFVINDADAKYIEYEHTGVLNSPNRRAVEIELTPSQIDKIGIRNTGYLSGSTAVMESVESVSMIKE